MSAYVPGSENSMAAGLGSLVIGSAAFVIGVVVGVQRSKLRRNGKRTTGTVTAIDRQTGSRGRTYYYPTISFATEDGVEHSWRRSVGESSAAYSVGAKVPVVYDPSDPRRASIDTFAEMFGIAIMIGLLGVFFAGVGWVLSPHDWAGVQAALAYVLQRGLSAVGLGTGSPNR